MSEKQAIEPRPSEAPVRRSQTPAWCGRFFAINWLPSPASLWSDPDARRDAHPAVDALS